MDNFAIGIDAVFKTALLQAQQARRGYPISYTPAHPACKIVARLTRERNWILVPERPGTFWQLVYYDPRTKTSLGGSNLIAFCTNAGRLSTSSFFLSCMLMFFTVL
jgi:hypothetical protein